MNADVAPPPRPRHRQSPRARRLAAENAGTGTPPSHLATFAVAEIEVDVTDVADGVVAYVAKEAVGAAVTLVVSGLISETVPPEPGRAGTLAIGAAVERPAIVRTRGGDPGIAIRSLARLTLAYDHRMLNRARATRLLTTVKHRLETPWTSAG